MELIKCLLVLALAVPHASALLDTTVIGATFENPSELTSPCTLDFGVVHYVGVAASFKTRGYNGNKYI
jgi:hypothetical protein